MVVSNFKYVVLAVALGITGCTGTDPIGDLVQYSSPMTTAIDDESVDDSLSRVATVQADTVVQRFHIAPYQLECQGFQLALCLLNMPADQADAQILYGSIEGFDYEWGYEYELLVRVASEASQLADALQPSHQLVEVISKSDYPYQQSFEYAARYTQESLVKVAPGEYLLAGYQTLLCDATSCPSIESALTQNQSALLRIQYGDQPGEALRLVAVICVESLSAFNEACLG